MALPQDSRYINNLITFTLDAVLPDLVDGFFQTNALAMRLFQREAKTGLGKNVKYYTGGAQIRAGVIYSSMGGGSYGKGQTFDTSFKEFATQLQFSWKRAYSPLNLDEGEVAENSVSETELFDYVETAAQNSMNSLFDILGYQFFATDPSLGCGATGATLLTPSSLDWDGIWNGVDDGTAHSSYGGITGRSGSATLGTIQRAISSPTNLVGGPFSLGMVQNAFGSVTYMPSKPDLIVTTQSIWNKWWDRVQAADRNPPGPLRDVGFDTIRFNGAEVVVDAHCPTGYIYILNTEFIRLCLMEGRDFARRGQRVSNQGFPVPNQDATVDQVIAHGNLIVTGSRFSTFIKTVS